MPIYLESKIFLPISERGCPTIASGWHFIETITAEYNQPYSTLLRELKRCVLGNENFCLEVDVLSICPERSRSAILSLLFKKYNRQIVMSFKVIIL